MKALVADSLRMLDGGGGVAERGSRREPFSHVAARRREEAHRPRGGPIPDQRTRAPALGAVQERGESAFDGHVRVSGPMRGRRR